MTKMRSVTFLKCLAFVLLGGFTSGFAEHISRDEIKDEILQVLPDIYGWCSSEKAINFMDLIFEVQPNLCVEIGVYCGSSFLPAAAAVAHNGHGSIVGIDPWDVVECLRYFDSDKDKQHIRFWAKTDFNFCYYGFLSLLNYYEADEISFILKCTSKKAAPIIGQIDILHLDGNHNQSVVLEDVVSYVTKVRTGGYVWLNDSKWESIQPAYKLILETCDVVKTIDNGNCTLFKKR
jgi:hypothetical protein